MNATEKKMMIWRRYECHGKKDDDLETILIWRRYECHGKKDDDLETI